MEDIRAKLVHDSSNLGTRLPSPIYVPQSPDGRDAAAFQSIGVGAFIAQDIMATRGEEISFGGHDGPLASAGVPTVMIVGD
jgi:hypothetical protein